MVEPGQLPSPSHQPREAPQAGGVEACAQRADPLELEDPDRGTDAFHRPSSLVVQGEEPLDQPGGMLGQVHAAGSGHLLHPRREPHAVSLGGVVHAQVVADLADHHLPRVEAHADGELEPSGSERTGIAPQLVHQVQRGVTRSPGVILVRDGSPEESHDPVAGELVDGAFEAMDRLGRDLEEAVENPMPFLRTHPLGEQHGVDHVGEQHRDLLALPFERAARGEDPFDELSRRVRARVACRTAPLARREPLPTGIAESLAHRVLGRAARTGSTALERGTALATEAGGLAVLVPAVRTPHRNGPSATL